MEWKEAKKMMGILQSAIQMEVDGKEFYQRASQKSSNKLGKELFQRLADEEDDHQKKFQQIYEALKEGQDWPDVKPPSEKGKKLKSIFAEVTKELGSEIKVAESELEAIKTAMDMENKTHDFYYSRSEQSTFPVEKRFYQTLAAEEQGHYLALLDSYEYLTDPVGWFTVTERWTLEGG